MSTGATHVVGGDVLLPGGVERTDVTVSDGRIRCIGSTADIGTDDVVLDVSGMLVAPGLIDLQCNGAGGADVTDDAGAIGTLSTVLPRFGVTSFLPTVVTSDAKSRRAAIEALIGFQPHGATARPLGLHFEGPAISPDHLGAHNAALVASPRMLSEEIEEWTQSGAVALVTLAPELDGGIAAIEQLCSGGVVVFAGHTSMTPGVLQRARAAGLRGVTHLFNAMSAFAHRRPGPVGAVLADDFVVASVICDGIHVDPVAVRVAWRSLGAERFLLVSDSSAPLGQPAGCFRLGRRAVVYDGVGVRTPDGVLAGSALGLDQAVRNLIRFTGCTSTEALGAATAVPADVLGRADIGRITVGARGDLIILDEQLRLCRTMVAGVTAWSHSQAAS
ncbi:N-acetylglucosamine-6-phosphate deacetylase [Candidatus Poriferisodalis sp.]|uniref:N-acetylglucosamine-6-phosphate deacetylase n=1 Tax=Candidatus Poriferisodalis sp. TaxID=3101277 RepID=UPI003B5A16EF